MHTKILVRTLTFSSRYQQWLDMGRNIHLEMLRGSYANEVFGQGSSDLVYECSPALSSITWSPGVLGIEDLGYMMDYFQSLMLKNNYICNLSDERNEVFDTGLKLTIQRHSLKPIHPETSGNKMDPMTLYGNIYLEHRFNSKHNSFSISANYYGRKPSLSFEKLMEILLG